ncbi:MAG: alpha/beta fold hydrolase [Phormidium sp.]|nr:MAG: putative hydrolases or acyltransferases (alpha/beta hydrolase superfamily) [Phormidium sp. OSCR]
MAVRHTLSLSETDLHLSYLDWGSPGAEPVILLHGLADHAGVWQNVGEALAAEGFRAIAPDLRGHGDSSKPPHGYNGQTIIQDLQALLNHTGYESAHILGHSWTGKVVPIWMRQHPQQFRSAILVDPFFIGKIPKWSRVTFPLLYRVLPFLQAMGPFPSHEAAVEQAKTLKQYRGWSQHQQQVFEDSLEQKPDGTWGSKFTTAARDGIFEDVMVVDGLTEPLTVPTLLIKPEGGLNRTQWQLKPYYRYLQNLQVCDVPGNHWAFLVEPTPFIQTLLTFLKQQQ